MEIQPKRIQKMIDFVENSGRIPSMYSENYEEKEVGLILNYLFDDFKHRRYTLKNEMMMKLKGNRLIRTFLEDRSIYISTG